KPEDLMDDRGEAALAEHVQQRLEVVPAPAVAAADILFAHPDIGLALGDVIATRCAAGANAAAGAGGAVGPLPGGGYGVIPHQIPALIASGLSAMRAPPLAAGVDDYTRAELVPPLASRLGACTRDDPSTLGLGDHQRAGAKPPGTP